MKRQYHSYLPGLIYVVVTILILAAAISTQHNLLFWVFGVLVAGIIISGLMTLLMMRLLEVNRMDPKNGSVDEPLVVRYSATNHSRFLPVFNLTIEEVPVKGKEGGTHGGWSQRVSRWLHGTRHGEKSTGQTASPDNGWQHTMAHSTAWIMHIGPGQCIHGEAVFWPRRRGEVHFSALRVSTSFPFGLLRKSITIRHDQRTLIYPKLYQLRPGILDAVKPTGPMGERAAHRPGEGEDFYGLREFRTGDSVRQIAWKQMARFDQRTDQLISIDRTLPSPPKLRVILNLYRVADLLSEGDSSETKEEKVNRVERAIDLTASFIYAAHLRGFEVGLSIAGMDIPSLPPRRSFWHLARLLGALARINLAQHGQANGKTVSQRPANLPSMREKAGVVVIHPARVDASLTPPGTPGSSRSEGWHLSAEMIDQFVTGPIHFGGDGLAPTAAILAASESAEEVAA